MIGKNKSCILLLCLTAFLFTFSCEKETTATGASFDYDLLYKTWIFGALSAENDVIVLWPDGSDKQSQYLPLSKLFTFYNNNTMIQYGFGPADEPFEFSGTWSFTAKDRIAITFDKGQSSCPDDYEIDIIGLEEDVLKIKKYNL